MSLPNLDELGMAAAWPEVAKAIAEYERLKARHDVAAAELHGLLQSRPAAIEADRTAILILDKNAEEELVTTDLARLLERLAPVADKLGCVDELGGIDEIVRGGASYQRQVAVGGTGTDLDLVAQLLVEEMRAGRPLLH
ncbi:MAG: hypothetical protein H0U37_02800 [Chloroflexi bacterium]|nr:hypothetical protein [Chloroflexota bacterium]